jgi:hypothetical protein
VDALSTADLSFLNAAALAELFEGDSLDFLILNFQSFFGFNPFPDFRAPFNDVKTTADNIITGTTVQNQVSTSFSFNFLGPFFITQTETFGTIKAQTALPMF